MGPMKMQPNISLLHQDANISDYQIPENKQSSLFPFPTSFDDSFEKGYIL